MNKKPYYRSDDNELMGYIEEKDGMYTALTFFGYPVKEGLSESEAKNTLLEKGLSILMDSWEFREKDSDEWQKCIIVEASEDEVKVAKLEEYPENKKTYAISKDMMNRLRH